MTKVSVTTFLTTTFFLLLPLFGFSQQKQIIGYYPSWKYYERNNLCKPANLKYDKLTIINYAFFAPDVDGNITGTDAWADTILLRGEHDWNNGGYLANTSLIQLAHTNNVKVFVSIGGWTLSENFPGIAADQAKRKKFASECVRVIKTYGFDGIDIDWEYGKVEVRAKLPQGRGIWPAIWMLPTESKYGNWPASGEIDIMEYVGYDPGVVHFNIHTEAYNHNIGTNKGASTTLNSPETNFYTYAVEWFPDSLVFKVDGRTYFKFNRESNDYPVWPFNEHFHLILNTAVGGSWAGLHGVDDNIFPQQFLVDYVRLY